MTQGGPGDATRSLVLLMYEQGFRWWNLGQARRDRVRLFCARRSRHVGGAAPAARVAVWGRGAAMRRARLRAPRWRSRWRPRHAGAAALDGLRLVHARGRGDGAPAAPPSERAPRSSTTPRSSRGSTSRALANSLVLATATAVSLALNSLAGYAFAKLRFRGRDRASHAPRRARGAGAGRDAAALPAAEGDGAREHLRGVIVPGWRASSASSSCASTPRQIPDACSTPRASTARARRASSRPSCCRLPPHPRDARRLHVPGRVERLPVAADRADRRGALHPAGRAREPRSASTCRTSS